MGYNVYTLYRRLAFLLAPHRAIDNLFVFQKIVGIHHAGSETPYGVEHLYRSTFNDCHLLTVFMVERANVVLPQFAYQPYHHLRTLGSQIVFPCHLVQFRHSS